MEGACSSMQRLIPGALDPTHTHVHSHGQREVHAPGRLAREDPRQGLVNRRTFVRGEDNLKDSVPT